MEGTKRYKEIKKRVNKDIILFLPPSSANRNIAKDSRYFVSSNRYKNESVIIHKKKLDKLLKLLKNNNIKL